MSLEGLVKLRKLLESHSEKMRKERRGSAEAHGWACCIISTEQIETDTMDCFGEEGEGLEHAQAIWQIYADAHMVLAISNLRLASLNLDSE